MDSVPVFDTRSLSSNRSNIFRRDKTPVCHFGFSLTNPCATSTGSRPENEDLGGNQNDYDAGDELKPILRVTLPTNKAQEGRKFAPAISEPLNSGVPKSDGTPS